MIIFDNKSGEEEVAQQVKLRKCEALIQNEEKAQKTSKAVGHAWIPTTEGLLDSYFSLLGNIPGQREVPSQAKGGKHLGNDI